MIDNRSLALLKILCLNSNGSDYKVFDVIDLLNQMPKEFSTDKSLIENGLNFLSERDYISVKYQDDKEVCLALTQKGRLVFEKRIDDEIDKTTSARKYFVWAFLGGTAGGVFSFIIYFILKVAFF